MASSSCRTTTEGERAAVASASSSSPTLRLCRPRRMSAPLPGYHCSLLCMRVDSSVAVVGRSLDVGVPLMSTLQSRGSPILRCLNRRGRWRSVDRHRGSNADQAFLRRNYQPKSLSKRSRRLHPPMDSEKCDILFLFHSCSIRRKNLHHIGEHFHLDRKMRLAAWFSVTSRLI